MKVYHFEFSKLGDTISGGEKCLIELVRYFKKKGLKNVLLTTDNGKETYIKQGLKEDKLLEYKIIKSYSFERKTHPFISYIQRTFKALKLVKSLKIEPEDVLICHNEYLPDSLPFRLLSGRNPKNRIFYFLHMVAPSLFRGYEGEFTGKWKMPHLNILHYILTQKIYRMLFRKRGTLIAYNPYYLEHMKKKYGANKIYTIRHFGGTEEFHASAKKEYDLAWVGRFHAQKGLFELIDIVKKLNSRGRKVKVLLIGDGEQAIKKRFFDMARENGIEKQIDYRGFLTGGEKDKLLLKSKIFAMTSYFESFGIVVIEAMKRGLPVVAYNLPVYGVFKKGIIKVPVLDNESFSKAIIKLLDDKSVYGRYSKKAVSFSKPYSWDATGEEIYRLITWK